MKEYYSLPPEYTPNKEEYTPIGKKTTQHQKEGNKRLEKAKKKLLRIFCTSAGALVLIPGFFSPTTTADIKQPTQDPPIITEQPDNPIDDVPIKELTYIECPDCHGSGIYCPGDPNFGYDRGNGHGYEGCGGTGFSVCPDIWCHEGIKTCQYCGGKGCQSCNNTGIVDCEFCANTGIAPCICADAHAPCQRCDGRGEILEGSE